MNPRTITYNQQIEELIQAVKPEKDLLHKGVNLEASLIAISRDNQQYAEMVQQYGRQELPEQVEPFDLSLGVLSALTMLCILITVYNLKEDLKKGKL